jgi:hypothetical protein
MPEKLPEEPDFDCVVVTDWGYPNQQIWTRESADAWNSSSSYGYLSWSELQEQGEITILTPSNLDAFEAGRKEGRFEVLRELDASLRKIGDATHKIKGWR